MKFGSPLAEERGRSRAHAAPRRTFATRRRLIVAFSILLAVFVSPLAFQTVTLRQMEATFAEIRDHEEEMRLALLLEHAIRDQYARQQRFVPGEPERLEEYEAARTRAVHLTELLSARVDEPETIAWMDEIRGASGELDRLFRESVAVAAGDAALTGPSYEPISPLVTLIEGDIDQIFGSLQETTTTFHGQLQSLETAASRWSATLLLTTPLFVAAVVLYLSRSVAKPLARLSDGAAAVAGGDLDARIDIDSPDEFGALAAEFNAMTVALKHNQERLVESEKLAGVGRLAAGIAHEINNPLQVMIGYLSLNRDIPDRRLAEQLAATEAEALRCKRIIEDLLELSRPALNPAPVDLRALCEDVVAGLRVSATAPSLRLGIEGAGLARGDASKLRQVVFNLMKNAVEAAGASGHVDVLIQPCARDHVEVAVCDSGPGIAAEARTRLFEPFFTTKATGTGLGLAVSRAIALAHGGDIEVKGGNAGGTVFTLRLPRACEGQGRRPT